MTFTRSCAFAVITAVVILTAGAQQAATEDHESNSMPKPKEYSGLEYRLSNALTDETDITASQMPLSNLLLKLSGMHDIKITIDKKAFKELEISPDKRVTFTAKKIPLGIALGQLTDKLNLTYIVRHDMLLLTSTKVAARALRIKEYRVAKALDGREDMIITNTTRSVRPKLWKSRGGNCEIMVSGTEISVVGNERLFQEVGFFLDKLTDKVAKAQRNEN